MTYIQITGQANSKDNRWLYTWFEDDTVMRQKLMHFGDREIIGGWEAVIPPVAFNTQDFWGYVPVAKSENETGE